MRKEREIYPNYTAETNAIDEIAVNGVLPEDGIDLKLLYDIISKHKGNSQCNRKLYKRYRNDEDSVPIFNRQPRFADEEDVVNNKLNNDFFSEIVDFKVGYFSGKPIGYSYSTTKESEQETGGDDEVEIAKKHLTDFVYRNNMFDVDMETTKYAALCGYSGRLLYINLDGLESVMTVAPYETIVLSDTEVTEPKYAIRYYATKTIDHRTVWKVELYDRQYIHYYEGNLGNLNFKKRELHCFDYCPLLIIPNNKEMIGDAEKVLSDIDAYDRAMSDCSNEVEGFARAYMVFENINISDEQIGEAQKTGAFKYHSGAKEGKVYYLTKDINDTFTENHLDRLEENIYRFSQTPNLSDESFYSASGISLKFKLTSLETKCGRFQAKMQSAGMYMFKLLSSSWAKRKITVDPMQCIMTFKRNFPLDILSEANAAKALIDAGFPQSEAYALALQSVDDVDYIMQLIKQEKDDIPSLLDEDNDTSWLPLSDVMGNPIQKSEETEQTEQTDNKNLLKVVVEWLKNLVK